MNERNAIKGDKVTRATYLGLIIRKFLVNSMLLSRLAECPLGYCQKHTLENEMSNESIIWFSCVQIPSHQSLTIIFQLIISSEMNMT